MNRREDFMNSMPGSRRFAIALICLASIASLGGCAGSYLQNRSASQAEHFNHQHLVGKRFETRLPIAVFSLRSGRSPALHGVPLMVVVGDRKNAGDLIHYHPEPVTMLPAGTVLEMVGEMAWHPSPAAVNAPSARNFDFFIVHDRAEARELLLPFPGWLVRAGLDGQAPRPHAQVDFPEPFLLEVDVPSQWTRERYGAIERAEWHDGVDLNLSRRVVRPGTQ